MAYYSSASLAWPAPGPMDVPSYQVSGVPWLTSSIAPSAGTLKITFPDTTRWVEVQNRGVADLRIGFSANGVLGNPPTTAHHFILPAVTGSTTRWELRCSSIYFSGPNGATEFSLAAGLTGIPAQYFDDMSGSLGGIYSGVG